MLIFSQMCDFFFIHAIVFTFNASNFFTQIFAYIYHAIGHRAIFPVFSTIKKFETKIANFENR